MSESVYKDFVHWLGRVTPSSPPPAEIAAYNFGIFASESGYTVYLVGLRRYDPADGDWACNEDYVPAEKYFKLPESLTIGADWRDVQRKVVQLVKRFIASPEALDSFFADVPAITVGFDDGDLERVK